MDFFADILRFVANNVFNEVAILIGLITVLGLALQRKPPEEVVAGGLRATIGVLVLFIGIDVFVAGLSAFQTIVGNAVGLEPPTARSTLDQFLASQGGSIALVITVGFMIHLLFVRLLRTRYVYLTGHLLFWVAVITTAALVEVFGAVEQWQLVLAGAIIVASYWTLQPLFIAPLMRRVIGGDAWGYGHTSSSVAWLAGRLGAVVGDPESDDIEKVRLPRQLSFFKDVNVSTALVITAIMLIAMAFADPAVVAEQAATYNPNVNPWMWGIIAGLRFAAGIAILLFGVRMFLAEIVPAFTGISERLIPGSAPALDVPTVFPFAPTAVMLGFVASTVVFLVLMAVFAAAGWFVLVPPMIMLFFPGAGAGVFGNAFGGWKGAVLGGALNGLVLAVGQAVTWGLLGDTAPELATLADPDWYLIIWLILALGAPLAAAGPSAVLVVPLIVLLGFGACMVLLKRRRLDEPLPATAVPVAESAADASDSAGSAGRWVGPRRGSGATSDAEPRPSDRREPQ